MQRKFILLGIAIMGFGALLTGAVYDLFFSDTAFALRTFAGYAVMGLGIFKLKRAVGKNTSFQGVVIGAILFVAGSLITGKLFELLSGNVYDYAKYFGGIAALSIGGWVSKHSLLGDTQ